MVKLEITGIMVMTKNKSDKHYHDIQSWETVTVVE